MPILFGVSVKNISPNFGDPRDGGARTHEGEDIMAVKGTPIISPTNAVVIRAGTGGSGVLQTVSFKADRDLKAQDHVHAGKSRDADAF